MLAATKAPHRPHPDDRSGNKQTRGSQCALYVFAGFDSCKVDLVADELCNAGRHASERIRKRQMFVRLGHENPPFGLQHPGAIVPEQN
jgi:hypothetical protein